MKRPGWLALAVLAATLAPGAAAPAQTPLTPPGVRKAAPAGAATSSPAAPPRTAPGTSSAGAPASPASSKAAAAPQAPVRASGPLAPAVGAAGTPELGPASERVAAIASAAASSAAASFPSAQRWVPVTITSKTGDRVPRVIPGDIGLVENGVRQRVTSIERWPLWLVIVLDVGRQVGPMKQLATHRQLVYDLISAIGEDDHVALLQYADGLEVIQPWTHEVTEAEKALDARFESGLEGQLWDSVSYAAESMLADKIGNRAVVVITDGVDDASQAASYRRALGLVHDTATTLYIVNLSRYLDEQIRKQAYGVNGVINVIQSPSYAGRRRELRSYRDKLGEAPPQMDEATKDSGGKLWMVEATEAPEALPGKIWREISGQYVAAYAPERPGETVPPVTAARSFSAFVTRGDIEVRVPARLFVPIAPPRAGEPGEVLHKKPVLKTRAPGR